jgi:hypothetical protein
LKKSGKILENFQGITKTGEGLDHLFSKLLIRFYEIDRIRHSQFIYTMSA